MQIKTHLQWLTTHWVLQYSLLHLRSSMALFEQPSLRHLTGVVTFQWGNFNSYYSTRVKIGRAYDCSSDKARSRTQKNILVSELDIFKDYCKLLVFQVKRQQGILSIQRWLIFVQVQIVHLDFVSAAPRRMGLGVLQAFAGGRFVWSFHVRSLVLHGLFDRHFLKNLYGLLLSRNV